MSHPAWYYIKYLAIMGRYTDPKSDTLGAVNETLSALKIPEVNSGVFDRIKAGIKFPAKLMLSNKEHAATVKFMKNERVHDVWNPANGDKEVFEFLQLSKPREVAQTLLMGRLPFEDIAEKITTRFRLVKQVDPRTIQLLCHYFWNVDKLSTKEWNDVLWGDPLSHIYIGAMSSPEQALFRAGFNPQVDGKEALKVALTHLFFRIEATRSLPDCKDTSDMLSKMIKELKSLEDALSSGGQEISDIIKELRAFKIANKELPPTSINDIISAGGGSFSGQLDGGKTNATINAEPGPEEMGCGCKAGDGEPAEEHCCKSDVGDG
jgi:hypothetical protein